MRIPCLTLILSLLSALCCGGYFWMTEPVAVPSRSNVSPPREELRYNRDVRPILAETCFRCHGPDPKTREAGLRLDDREAALDAGVIDLDSLPDSEILARVESPDPDLVMPPPDSLKQLTAAEKELLRNWVEAGAEYEPHWAYLPPQRPTSIEADTPAAAIDALLGKALQEAGLPPQPRADRRTLLRRIYLDLVGFPPTLEEQTAFLADDRDDAYPRLVEKLLASPHYGERMATGWLDVVRYADTVGYHGDQNQNVFPYRDWVVQAFNDNLPFDRFTVYQLAGDLIDEPTKESLIASCFNRLNMMTREGGAQPEEYLAKYAADRVRTVAGAWLGSTIGCAECHDHKYDPFSTRDFYRLAAFFADLRQWGVYSDYGYTPNPDLRGWSNDHPFPPEIRVAVPYLQRRIEALRAERDRLAVEAFETKGDTETLAAWQAALQTFLRETPEGWRAVDASDVVVEQGEVIADPEGGLRLAGEKIDRAVISIPGIPGGISSIALELLGDPDHEGKLFAGGGANLNWTAQVVDRAGQPQRKVGFHFADSAHSLPRYSNTFEILGILGQWRVDAGFPSGTQGVWVLNEPLQLGEDERLQLVLTGNRCHRLRIRVSPLVPEDLQQPDAWQDRLSSWAGNENAAGPRDPFLLRQFWLTSGQDRDIVKALRETEQSIRECRQGEWPVQVSVSQDPRVTRVLPRGNWQDQSGEIVEPGVPEFLPGFDVEAGQRATRLDLAHWLVSPENPLTARVQMNRLWKHFFGAGLSPVLDDLGIQGEYPSNPELLDYLAVEFRKSGWNWKHMVRGIVLSKAYQRTSLPSQSAREKDPKNTRLSHQNPRRLEAEIVRDNALAISGLLNRDIGGPPVFPYQPGEYYEHLQFPDRRYTASTDDRQYRRGLYMHWQRTFLHPMLANFDAPSREECTGMRLEANTPLQALTLLNDPTFVEAARVLAMDVMATHAESDERIEALFLRALARPPTGEEQKILENLLIGQRQFFADDPDGATRFLQIGLAATDAEGDVVALATWTSIARAVLNLHETITRY